jgi:hypothetical protein
MGVDRKREGAGIEASRHTNQCLLLRLPFSYNRFEQPSTLYQRTFVWVPTDLKTNTSHNIGMYRALRIYNCTITSKIPRVKCLSNVNIDEDIVQNKYQSIVKRYSDPTQPFTLVATETPLYRQLR